MTARTEIGALAAWASPPPSPDDGDPGAAVAAAKPTPFRAASFDDVHGAVAAALLLMSAVPHRNGTAPIGIAIALGDRETARAEADALASRAPFRIHPADPGRRRSHRPAHSRWHGSAHRNG